MHCVDEDVGRSRISACGAWGRYRGIGAGLAEIGVGDFADGGGDVEAVLGLEAERSGGAGYGRG